MFGFSETSCLGGGGDNGARNVWEVPGKLKTDTICLVRP